MAIERDLDLLDDYLGNRLSGGEKEAFERKLESDPTLKSEYQLQQKLIEGIKKARVAELKTMLNNTPIPSVGGQQLFTKIATWTVVTGVVVTGAYFFFSKQDVQTPEPQQQAVVENKIPAETSAPATQPSTPVTEDKETVTNEAKQPATVEKKINKKTTGKTADKTSDNAVSQRPAVFDPTTETEGDANARPEQPQAQVTPEATEDAEVKASKIQVTAVTTDKKHTFDYQFRDGKVLLYGPFERDLYEILEFFSGTKRTAFLYYKDNYYLLNDNDQKIKQLVPINDPALLNKLKEFRSKSK